MATTSTLMFIATGYRYVSCAEKQSGLLRYCGSGLGKKMINTYRTADVHRPLASTSMEKD